METWCEQKSGGEAESELQKQGRQGSSYTQAGVVCPTLRQGQRRQCSLVNPGAGQQCAGPVKVYRQHTRSSLSVPDSDPCAPPLSTAHLLLPESHGGFPRGLSGNHPKA